MNKILIFIAIGLVVVIGGFFLLNNYIYETKQEDPIHQEVVAVFQEEMTTRGVELLGAHPVEGFDAFLLLGAFPGLEEQDFDGVMTFEGVYVHESGELHYERTVNQPITSAEQTVSVEGYGILLRNISARMGVDVQTQEQVFEIVDIISATPSTSIDS